jgi:cyanophycin synthetase
MVERFIRGVEHRLLVVGGKHGRRQRAARAWVVGDGKHDVVELIDPRSTPTRAAARAEFPLEPRSPDATPAALLELQRQGFTPTRCRPPARKC